MVVGHVLGQAVDSRIAEDNCICPILLRKLGPDIISLIIFPLHHYCCYSMGIIYLGFHSHTINLLKYHSLTEAVGATVVAPPSELAMFPIDVRIMTSQPLHW